MSNQAETTEGARRYVDGLNAQQRDALTRYGYTPTSRREASADHHERFTGAHRIPLRNHVCELDGVEIDRHGGTDLNAGLTSCIYYDYEGRNPRPLASAFIKSSLRCSGRSPSKHTGMNSKSCQGVVGAR